MKSVGVVVPHTHWDREWRYPLWKTRALLVDSMDGLLDVLEGDPDYRCFVTDGQCIPVEDYLEIRPQNRERIRVLVQAGRLAIGPWYTLPDLYPVDGECLVRNLLKGIRTCAELGGHLGVAFTSFGWGQTAQFPQIYKGFDIDFAVVAKRVSPRRAPHSEFVWEAPDGTSILATRLGEYGRANFFFRAYQPVAQGADYFTDEYAFDPQQRRAAMHRADVDKSDEEWRILQSREGFDSERLRKGCEDAWDEAGETLVPEYRLLMSGSDFTGAQSQLPRLLREANALFDDREFVMGTLDEYAAGLAERLDRKKLAIVHGELRDGGAFQTSGNALATRIHLKQLNRQAEILLLRRAEPLAAVLAAGGDVYPTEFLSIAWRHVLQSHAHDSINGVTQDKTADDVVNRLQQAIEIAGALEEERVGRLASRIDASRYDKGSALLLVVNPLVRNARPIVEACVDLPRDASTWDFDAFGPDGEPLAVQHESRRERVIPVNDPKARPRPFRVDRHVAFVDVGDVSPGGYKVIELRPRTEWNRTTEFWVETRRSRGDEVGRRPDLLENEFLRVEIAENGTFTLTDKRSGRVSSGLNVFEDTGDVGDYWVYYPPYENRTYTSLGSRARIWMEENGPLSATACTEIEMEVPAHGLRPERSVAGPSRRSEATARLTITSRITLRKGGQR
ncbi:MAG: alpha-mannosidase, partial [Lentisphaerae bacterium]|nr:alpha-mannosidase [Lentisphaerota bacterium]